MSLRNLIELSVRSVNSITSKRMVFRRSASRAILHREKKPLPRSRDA